MSGLMRVSLAVAVALLVALRSVAAATADTTPSLVGAIYVGNPAPGATVQLVPTAIAVIGAQAFLRADGAEKWIGPAETDIFGRFTFPSIARGTYQLRIYRSSVRLWDQRVDVPTILKPIIVRETTVAYYAKASDRGKIAAILEGLSFPFELRSASYPVATNTIWFGDNVPRDDVRSLATTLVSEGVGLRAIRRFSDGSGLKANLIEIGASAQHLGDPILTTKDIDRANDWPRAR